jgi:hypothetical protein
MQDLITQSNPILNGDSRGDMAAEIARLNGLDAGHLRQELLGALEMTVRQVIRLAVIFRRLEELGEDLSDLRLSILPYVRRIAYGQMAPEVLVQFQGSPALLRAVGQLPLPDQLRISAGDPIKLLEESGDHRLVPALNLSPEEMRQAFGAAHLRDEAEQATWLRTRRLRAAVPKAAPNRIGRILIDRQRGGLVLGRSFFSPGDVLSALALLADPEYREEPTSAESATVVIKTSESDHRRLKIAAATNGTTIGSLVRRALRAAGIIRGQEEGE